MVKAPTRNLDAPHAAYLDRELSLLESQFQRDRSLQQAPPEDPVCPQTELEKTKAVNKKAVHNS